MTQDASFHGEPPKPEGAASDVPDMTRINAIMDLELFLFGENWDRRKSYQCPLPLSLGGEVVCRFTFNRKSLEMELISDA